MQLSCDLFPGRATKDEDDRVPAERDEDRSGADATDDAARRLRGAAVVRRRGESRASSRGRRADSQAPKDRSASMGTVCANYVGQAASFGGVPKFWSPKQAKTTFFLFFRGGGGAGAGHTPWT